MFGDSFADILMFLALIRTTHIVAARYPPAYVGMVCDDLQVLSIGTVDFLHSKLKTLYWISTMVYGTVVCFRSQLSNSFS